MALVTSGIFASGAIFIAIMFLLLISSAGSIMTYVIIVIANRADPDPTGKRPMAAYFFGGSFLSMDHLHGLDRRRRSVGEPARLKRPEQEYRGANRRRGFLMVLVGGVAHTMHRRRGLALADSESDPSSPTKRVMRSYVAAVSFISILIALISIMVLGYLIFEFVAPGVFGAAGTRMDTLTSIIDSVYIVGATAFVFFTHQALAPSALRLLPRGFSSTSAAANVEG